MNAERRGFNLVEAAIVLGVVGLVIGGIWTAASQMRTNYLVNQLTQDILTIVDNARGLVNGNGPFPSYDWFVLIYYGEDILPKGYDPTKYTGACGFPTPYNYCIAVQVGNYVPGTLRLIISSGDMTKAVCIRLATKLGLGMTRETTKLAVLQIGWTGYRWGDNTNNWSGINASDIEAGCSIQTGLVLDFYR